MILNCNEHLSIPPISINGDNILGGVLPGNLFLKKRTIKASGGKKNIFHCLRCYLQKMGLKEATKNYIKLKKSNIMNIDLNDF